MALRPGRLHDWVAPENQIWEIKEWATLVAMLAGLAALLPLGLILLRTKSFSSLQGSISEYACTRREFFKYAAHQRPADVALPAAHLCPVWRACVCGADRQGLPDDAGQRHGLVVRVDQRDRLLHPAALAQTPLRRPDLGRPGDLV